MFKKQLLLISAIIALLIPTLSLAAKAEVKWTNPDKYRDIYPNSNESRKNFRAHVFKNFDKFFAKLAIKLATDQTLKIDVTDLDLAGDVNFGSSEFPLRTMDRIRVVSDLYFPRIKFSYQLVNSNGEIVAADKLNLKDMNFMLGNNLRYQNQAFSYDKKMIADWFHKTFKDQLIKQK